MLPIVHLNSSSSSCIYSTLCYVVNQAHKLDIVKSCLTFYQPLWIKAVDICHGEFLDIFAGLADSIH